MSTNSIQLRIVDQIAILTLDRPDRLNAITEDMAGEAVAACDEVARDAGVRALLITGQGRGFCSGADLRIEQDISRIGAAMKNIYNPLLECLFNLPIPVVTAVNGPAIGAGCSIGLAGDLVIAARSAYFSLAFVNVGLVPDLGSTWMLPRLIGRCRASAMMLLGERVTATQALEWGMVWKVFDDDDLQEEAFSVALALAHRSSTSIRLIRKGIREALDGSLEDALNMEAANQQEACLGDDYQEGARAFREKRKAVFGPREVLL